MKPIRLKEDKSGDSADSSAAKMPTYPDNSPAKVVVVRQSLEERLRLLENVVLSINDVVLITEAEPFVFPGPRVVYVNEAFKRMTGYSSEEIIGKTPRILQGPKTERDQLDKIRAALHKWESVRVEMTNYRKDGTEFNVELSISPIADEQGWFTHWVSVQRETTERKEAEEALNNAHRQLRIANEQLEARVNQRTAELSASNQELKGEISERQRIEEKLIHDAFHDTLTGLPNRAMFIDRLKIAIARFTRRGDRQFAVFFIDLDRFKLVNDILGHLNGDNLLVETARRLEAVLRSCDIVARLGGDEFMIMVEDLHDPNDAYLLAQQIQEVLRQPFEISGHELFVSASIGIALSGGGYLLPEAMMRDADIAMYRAKTAGKARSEMFDKEMHVQGVKRLQLETELRRAIQRDEFTIRYQPIINLDTLKIAGFEALVRWNHPERGLLAPDQFIAIAEETGMIVQIGQWVLRESCRQQQVWETRRKMLDADIPPLTISVNLSCKQFLQPDLVEQVEAALYEAGLPASCLKLEITESHIMENPDVSISMMNRLRVLGVEFSLDDFGTGYSSLDHLHRLPVSYLKIDRSFVNRMQVNGENCEIVQTIIMLARNFKMKVVAEGIETEAHLEQLQRFGSDFGQGYLFAKPQTAETIENLIISESTKPALVYKRELKVLEFAN